MAKAATCIAINMNINKVPVGANYHRNLSDERHVVLNLDAVVINPKMKFSVDAYKKFDTLEAASLKILGRCQRLFITKSGDPWLRTYRVKTPANQGILTGKSGEIRCCLTKQTTKTVQFLNSRDKEMMRIEFHPVDYALGTHERSFTVKTPGGLIFANPDRKLGIVNLQEINGFHFLHGIFSTLDNMQFTSRSKRDVITIIHEGQPVAIIDLQRTKVLYWIESYMVTFTKEISHHSKALIISAVVSYDIAFYRRTDTVKTILVYILFLIILFSGAFTLFVYFFVTR